MRRGKGDRHLLCEAPEGPFRQKVPVPFSVSSSPAPRCHAMSQSTVTRTLVVANRQGLHARAAVLIVTAARRFQAKAFLVKGLQRVEATEVLQVLSLGAAQGEQLTLEAEGREAQAAADAIEQLFLKKFDEE
jgi:phosphocarrier protein HPr